MLKRGLNFAVAIRLYNLDMVCADQSARSKLPPRLRCGVLFEDSMYVGNVKTVDT